MLATRDPFWVIPGWVPLLVAIAVAVYLFASSAYRLYALLRLGKPDERFDQPGERFKGFVQHVLAQGRMFRDPIAGPMHALIFWGFLVITLASAEMLLGGLFQGFRLPLIGEWGPFLLSLELFQALVLVAVGVAFYRRLVSHPLRLNFTGDALLILALISALMVTAFLASGFAIGCGAPCAAHASLWKPVGSLLGGLFGALGPATNLALHKLFWWTHVLVLLGFLAYLPHSKHLHIVTSFFNVWFRSTRPKGQLSFVDIEKALEQDPPAIGARQITDLSWKHLLDTYTCTECGRCEAACPAAMTGKALSPKQLILDLKHHLIEEGPHLLAARGNGASASENETAPAEQANGRPKRELVGQVIADEVLWDCVTCRACMTECPVFIEHVPKIVDMRRHLVMVESRFGTDLQRLFDNLEAAGNPWRFPRMTRANWANDLGIPTMADDPGEIEVLYWVGCAGSLDERNVKVARAFARLLQTANVKFAILGNEETCTGDPDRRAGNEYLFQVLAQQNVATLNGYGIKKIVATCPHCFNTIRNEYPQLNGSYEVVHHVEFIDQLIKAGRLKPSVELEQAVAYHDPCYLGRYNDIYDQPRDALKAVPGLQLREIGCNRDKALCCGAGGARAFVEEKVGKRINHVRVEQAMAVDPQVVATGCPYCLMMFEDGTRAKGVYDSVPVADLAEIVERSLAGQPSTSAAGGEHQP